MFATLIGTGVGLASSLIGGNKAKKEMRRSRAIYKNQLQRAQAEMQRYANQDFSQSASAQDAIAQTQQLNEQNLQNARGADAVMGTRTADAAVAANADAQAKLASSLAQQGEAQRKAERQYYGSQIQAAENQIATGHAAQAQQNQTAANQGMQAGMGLATADLKSQMATGNGIIGNMFGFNESKTKDPNYEANLDYLKEHDPDR